MIKTKILLFCIIFLLIGFVSSYNLQKEVINNIAIHDYENPAEFLFKFTNAKEGYYEIFTFVDVNLLPEEKFLIENGTGEVIVKVYPTKRIKNIKGPYSFIFYVRDPDRENIEERLRINLKDITDIFEIYSDSNFPDEKISFYVENKENISLKNVRAKFSSILFEEEKNFSIGPSEKKEFIIKINKEKMKRIPAGQYLIDAVFFAPSGEEYRKQGKLTIGEKKEIFGDYKKEGYFIKEETLIKKNLGNVVENVQFINEKNLLSYFFVSFNEKPDKIEREGLKVTYLWSKKLAPNESAEIKIRTNFLIPFISLLLILGIAYLIKKYYSESITIKKYAHHVRTKGGEFAVRIRIHVKANRSVRNVSINEKVPSILKIYKNFSELTPNIIDEKRNKLVWNLGDLQAGEERVFSYIVYSKVGVYGKVIFPESVGIYERGTKILETISNKVFFLSEQAKNI
ncbi:MAG: hypothetical protein QXX68_03080 [Candidatus Pacearchaeota archaeon]